MNTVKYGIHVLFYYSTIISSVTFRGRLRHRWEDNIKMDLMEIGFWGLGLDSFGSG
jgi:hypothetical protein